MYTAPRIAIYDTRLHICKNKRKTFQVFNN